VRFLFGVKAGNTGELAAGIEGGILEDKTLE
jgi:hypothetical protein